MPIYEYKCEACGHRFERIQKFSDPPIEVCPNCGKPDVRKLLSSPAIQFKGSGFYINDYASKGSGGTDSKGDTKSGSKSAESKDSDERMEASLRRIETHLGTLPSTAPSEPGEEWKLPETPLEAADRTR